MEFLELCGFVRDPRRAGLGSSFGACCVGLFGVWEEVHIVFAVKNPGVLGWAV